MALVGSANADVTSRRDSDRQIVESANKFLKRAERYHDRRIHIHDDFSAGDRYSGVLGSGLASAVRRAHQLDPSLRKFPHYIVSTVIRGIGENKELKPVSRVV